MSIIEFDPRDEPEDIPDRDFLLRMHREMAGPDIEQRAEAIAERCLKILREEQSTLGTAVPAVRRPVSRARWAIAAGLLVAAGLGAALLLWPRGPSAVPEARLGARRSTAIMGHGKAEGCWALTVAFPGKGYVHILSRSPGGGWAATPKDSAQKLIDSSGADIPLGTLFPLDARPDWLVCVTDLPAARIIVSLLNPDGAEPPDGPDAVRRTLSAGLGKRLIAFGGPPPRSDAP